MRRAYALPLVLVVLGLLTVAITALALSVRGTIDNAHALAAQARAQAVGRGILAAMEASLVDAVAAGQTTMIDATAGSMSAWELARREGGNSCVRATTPTVQQRAAAPSAFAISESHCFVSWVSPDFSLDTVRLGQLALPALPAPRGSGLFPDVPVTSSGALLSVTIRDHRKNAQATTTTAFQVVSTSPFSLQGYAAMPAVLPSTVLNGAVHVDGNVCLGAAAVARVTSAGRAGCAGDDATVAGRAVSLSPESWLSAHEGRLRDARHGGRALRGPFVNMRELLAPPVGGESSLTRLARLASQAGVRIIDGAWFARSSSSPTSWPGRLLWSDHPGHAPTTSEESVLLGAAVDVGRAALGAPVAHLYSRYDDDGSGTLHDDGDGAVFFGALTRSGGVHVPAAPSGTGLVVATTDEQRLAGARLLVKDGTTGDTALPLNLDIAALARAQASSDTAELGTSGAWNGVVWISSSWPGRSTGSAIPGAGGSDDDDQPPAVAGGQRALPDAFCSQTDDGDAWAGAFVVPACRGDGPRPTMVRLLNGQDLRAFAPDGLAIVTDLPLVVVGDWNTATLDGAFLPSVLAADRIVQVSNTYTDVDALALPGATGSVARSVALSLRAHLLSGLVPRAGFAHFDDVVGVVESPALLSHQGSRVVLGAARTAGAPLPATARPSSLTWAPWDTPAPASLSIGVVVDVTSARIP
jgi:hypothetical protein